MGARREGPVRVLILSATFGGAHRSVADALVRYLKIRHARDADVTSVDFLEHAAPKANVLAKFAYQQGSPFFPVGDGDFDELVRRESTSPVMRELEHGGYERAERLFGDATPDAVISTLPLAAAVASDVSGARGFFSAAVITDFSVTDSWLHPATDAYFVPCKEVSDELVVRGVEWGRISVAGLAVTERGSSALAASAVRADTGLAERFTAALLLPPGASGESLQIASRLAEGGIQVAVVIAESPRLLRPAEGLAAKSSLIRVIDPGVATGELLRAADVAICRPGGATVPQSVSAGVPLIVYDPVPGQERRNVDFLVNSGAALLARDEQDAAEKARFLSTHPARRAQIAGDSAGLGRSDGAQLVCERVLAAVG